MSFSSSAWAAATRSADRVTSSSTRARLSWCAGARQRGSTCYANGAQLDAGMHPAYEGLSAMPFYDEFDLSTVDVLLISQYVPCPSPCCSVAWVSRRIAGDGQYPPGTPIRIMYISINGISFASPSSDSGDVPARPPLPTCTLSSSSSFNPLRRIPPARN